MKFSPLAIVACMLCVGILALGFNSPQQSRLDAEDIVQKKAEISATEQMARDLMDSLKNQQVFNSKLAEADKRTIDLIGSLQESVKLLGESVVMMKDNVPTREEVTKLVLTAADEATKSSSDNCDCTCGEKMAELQKQIDLLKARVDVLELTRATVTSAAATSSYGTVTRQSSVVASGGSTGSVKSGGSTGSVSVVNVQSYQSTGSVKSGGSTGSVLYSSQPAADAHIDVVSTPTCTRCPAVIEFVTREYTAAGWTVGVVSEDQRLGISYPYFRICVGSQCEEIHCDVSQLGDSVRQVLTKWGVNFGNATTGSSGPSSLPASGDSSRRQPLRTAYQLASSPLRASGAFLSQWGTGRALEVARASAQHRAANRIKGHSQVDLSSGMANGVGWSTSDSQPRTCFWNRRAQGAYASVQGVDGYYGTLVLY